MIQNSISDNRIVWLDVIRCVAMIMVIGVHCIDPFLHFSHNAGYSGIHALGSDLWFTAPSVGTSVCYDDGTASAPRKKTTTG